jgi:hypothetical protein
MPFKKEGIMARKDIIKMSQRELRRAHIIHNVLDKKLKQVEASRILELSDREIRRLIKRVRKEGDRGIIHKSRGRESNRMIPKKIKQRVIDLYKQKYNGFGPTLASEKLFELNKIKISDETLRIWLIKEGIWQRVRTSREHRQWRERKHCFGEMIQMDGSPHKWFENRGPESTLMGCIDDATSEVFGRFYEYEGTIPAMDCFKQYIKKYGIPCSVYMDRHSTYKSTAKPTIEDELQNKQVLTQFGRVLEELGVKYIPAGSPQAKGRIERLFGTFQDRLVKEMRLRKIKTIKEANKFLEYYLPIYNKRFTVKPIKNINLHRPLPEDIDLDIIFSIKTPRVLRNDFTVAHDKKLYQVLEKTNAKKVIVEERLNGKMFITYKNKKLEFKKIDKRLKKQKDVKKHFSFSIKKKYIPPKNHPWRQFNIKNSCIMQKDKKAA